MKSQGVVFLNSVDETFLHKIACSETIQNLNRAVLTICRLGRKCTDDCLAQFDQAYTEMNSGIMDLGRIEYDSKPALKLVEKMEKYVNATSHLHSTMVALSELEVSERKIKQWKKNVGSKLPNKTNLEYFNEKISFQRKQAKHYREVSLWNQSFDQAVGLMTRIVYIIFARICVVFGPFVPGLPRVSEFTKSHSVNSSRFRVNPTDTPSFLLQRGGSKRGSKSGPIPYHSTKIKIPNRSTKSGPLPTLVKPGRSNSAPLRCKRVHQMATEATVGAAGLAVRYANVIVLAECYLHAPMSINDDARGLMYDLLPEHLKTTVRGKLCGHWRKRMSEEEKRGGSYKSLVQGWRDALEEMMTWLAPIGHDTLKWQQERNLEKQRFDVKPTVSLFQTLYFSDLEKTEAVIAEVLVGLSCIYRYEKTRQQLETQSR